ncbi:oxidoreductase [Dichomitus squalens]|uniref:Oxidoreductase n=1 Tax=Dichomitus squalens TaxID=114155 RepID=A0A4Q9PL27_9APHY|nr:oxidoreductase [Dichomitus squalens]
MSSTQKIVLVTGCSQGGIGAALCEEYASKGCKVYATARRLEAMHGFTHGSIELLQLDVTNQNSIDAVVNQIIEKDGRIDILVNNAGMTCSGPVVEVELDRLQKTFDTNVFGIVRVCRAVIPYVAARKSGTIVNMGSILAHVALPFAGIYSASKAAVHSITEALYMECLPFDISVVLVDSGGAASNIINNMAQNVGVPTLRIYGDYVDVIREDFNPDRPEVKAATPLDEYARGVVKPTLEAKPPRSFGVGSGSTLVPFIASVVPRGVLLRYLWQSLVEKKRVALAKAK